jgi:hypothetical protein
MSVPSQGHQLYPFHQLQTIVFDSSNQQNLQLFVAKNPEEKSHVCKDRQESKLFS